MEIKNYGFAESSMKKLEDAHIDLRIILNEVKKVCMIDFDISSCYRTTNEQMKLYLSGKSQLDGITKKSKHQEYPSEAVDIYAYKYKSGGKASYTKHQLSYIAGVIQGVANYLYIHDKIYHIIRWGGNWDSDGWIIDDQTFQDLCHFELLKI